MKPTPLLETLLDDAHVVAERIRKKINISRFHHLGEEVSVTLSCGYAALEEEDTVPSLFQRVQPALARARAAGGGGYNAGQPWADLPCYQFPCAQDRSG
ncbi:MAG: hypothetical protein OEM48_09090 [Gammaproteobacteria bacterium]|nr:hypothetical protein [Gammaproteobacteria bacterium]MDH3562542.1 hypothetical protein [Gammaproteobacteria bacterium]